MSQPITHRRRGWTATRSRAVGDKNLILLRENKVGHKSAMTLYLDLILMEVLIAMNSEIHKIWSTTKIIYFKTFLLLD